MISAFVGHPGGGKTARMVMEAINHYRNFGYPIYSNIHMRHFEYERTKWTRKQKFDIKKVGKKVIKIPIFSEAKYYPSNELLKVMLTVKTGLFVIDEAGGVFNNRLWRKQNPEVMARFQKSRHFKIDVMYTTQDISRVDIFLRQLTTFMTECKWTELKYLDHVFPLWATFDKYSYEVIDKNTEPMKELHRISRRFMTFKQMKPFLDMYDTTEDVNTNVIDNVVESKIVTNQPIAQNVRHNQNPASAGETIDKGIKTFIENNNPAISNW